MLKSIIKECFNTALNILHLYTQSSTYICQVELYANFEHGHNFFKSFRISRPFLKQSKFKSSTFVTMVLLPSLNGFKFCQNFWSDVHAGPIKYVLCAKLYSYNLSMSNFTVNYRTFFRIFHCSHVEIMLDEITMHFPQFFVRNIIGSLPNQKWQFFQA